MQNEIWSRLLSDDVLPYIIPLVVIVSVVIIVIVKKVISHRERMAMIERSIHPDYPSEYEEERHNS
jgi:hypothetical protein